MKNVHDSNFSPCIEVFSKRLKHIRASHGISQKKLGILAGIDEFVASTRINRYETGKHEADMETVARIAHALNIPRAYFYADDDNLAELILQFYKNENL
ncbi:helix-turn-helix domain-containing protein [Zophobihabitans entericus]|uniref:Helix-turn-helix transcriptional regulator n=1 Tax=Zophobihabitans entericus TaxID=1635327 RepID=A0A6G9IED1_9GAMM|nr:helix-turn-helix transcriptional regulator [Zophobihabitans entericus]QIQ22169.1 helix-turn-helix transcriptional regulator [Zophobihabitans entericus]